MDLTLSDEQQDFRRTLRSFLAAEAPTDVIRELDRTETFPADLYAKMAGLGLTSMGLPEEYGGTPCSEIDLCIALEEVARVGACLSYALVPTLTFCGRGIAGYGTPEQKQRYLPGICSGEIRMAMALSEPEVGSDLTHLSTRAVRDGDIYVINGQKVFTTGADTADYLLAIVRTDPDAPASKGLSVLIVPRTAEGVTVRPLPKLAGQATHTCEVYFSDVRVPVENQLGELNAGAKIVFGLLDGERVFVGAQCTGIAQGALDLATGYAKERHQFGKPIIEHQAVGHLLADMAMDVRVARLVTWEAALLLEQGRPCSTEASVAKVTASEAASRCVSNGMSVLGGYSYMTEFAMERYWREVKLYEIAGGTNQIQRNIIARSL
ncbi:acyl-CoA dehydrogenase family protein [Streptomyces sp. Y7]|uniref:acyl-CoA dehydrogenase family protein n=1 Tax=Streptomyces sp. Y7 TaxID=3342392 RepID=UPI0037247814